MKSRGAIKDGFYLKKADWPAQHPSLVISVPDINVAMKMLTKQGGKVLG